ncbi:MAG: hypothetical protein WHF31_16205 [Candidatus Dehalobacter alkaniphilus]
MDKVDELYHTCRWCKWLEKGKCTNEHAFNFNTEDEDGKEVTLNGVEIADPNDFFCKHFW